jgi:hypothetical protein
MKPEPDPIDMLEKAKEMIKVATELITQKVTQISSEVNSLESSKKDLLEKKDKCFSEIISLA